MRGIILAACAALLLSGCAGLEPTQDVPGELPEDHWSKNPAVVPFMKIGRGVTNIVASPFDIPATMVRAAREEDNMGYAVLAGLAEGVGNCIVRLGAGALEILSFPLVTDPEPLYQRRLGERAIRTPRSPLP